MVHSDLNQVNRDRVIFANQIHDQAIYPLQYAPLDIAGSPHLGYRRGRSNQYIYGPLSVSTSKLSQLIAYIEGSDQLDLTVRCDDPSIATPYSKIRWLPKFVHFGIPKAKEDATAFFG